MAQDPEKNFDTTAVKPPPRRSGWLTLLLVVAVGVVVVAMLLPAVRTARPAAYRAQCSNQLKQIARALLEYEQTYGRLPPAYTVDADGKPLHSWRTLILPFLEYGDVHERIDLSKSWDDPANAEAYKMSIAPYRCPVADCPPNHTTYLASVSSDGCFRPDGSVSPQETSGNRSRMLMVIEAPSDRAVHWMSPLDADEALIMDLGPKSKLSHGAGVTAALCDGGVRFFVVDDLPAAVRRALISGSANYEAMP